MPLLGIHPASITPAIDAGLIERMPNTGIALMLKRSSVEEFAEKYTTTVKLCGASKAMQREAQRRLADAGVRPVLTKAINPRCRGAIYRVADIPADLKETFAK